MESMKVFTRPRLAQLPVISSRNPLQSEFLSGIAIFMFEINVELVFAEVRLWGPPL